MHYQEINGKVQMESLHQKKRWIQVDFWITEEIVTIGRMIIDKFHHIRT